jgi:hypothetical protein|tara:strand:+ start:90 stop:641 length:552 start_codon:yes stop_codon:yes gene_type:complete
MEFVDKMLSQCKENPLFCVVMIVLIAAIIQNCVMDIGLGPYLGKEGFSNLLGDEPSMPNQIQPSDAMGSNVNNMGINDLNRTPSTCYPQQALKPEDLLPSQESEAIKEFNTAQPVGEGILQDVNLLEAGAHIGINSVGQSLRNANRQLRSDPPNPQVNVSPWMNTTIGPDLPRRPLEVGESCA